MSVIYFGHQAVTKDLFQQQLVYSPPPIIGFDTETISLRERMPLGFAIATSPRESWYFHTYPEMDKEVELVLPLLNNPDIKKVIHNAMFDLRAITLVISLDSTNIADTNVMARLLGYIETSLGLLAPEVGMFAEDAGDLIARYKGKTMLDVPPEKVAAKGANDARVALALYHSFLPKIDPEYFKVEMDVIPILIKMSLRGMKIDQRARAIFEGKLEKEVAFYRQICASEDFNPASNQQVGYILAKRGNFLPLTRSRKNLQVDEDALEFLDDPLAAVVLNFRRQNGLLTKYIKPLKDEDRIYTEYNLDAVVGRISSSNRNLQNIPPGEARNVFLPDSGIFTTGDYRQEHLYILMHMSDDRQLRRVYEEGEMGGDVHAFTARALGVSRTLAKTLNYAICYGATPKTISYQAKIRDIYKCSRFLDQWFETFRDVKEWIKGAQETALRDGWSLPTLFGRRIRVPEENEEAMKRKGVNYPILGSDGEIIKRALIRCAEDKLPLVVTTHDDITCDGDIEFPVEDIENIAPVRIPFDVKKSTRWE